MDALITQLEGVDPILDGDDSDGTPQFNQALEFDPVKWINQALQTSEIQEQTDSESNKANVRFKERDTSAVIVRLQLLSQELSQEIETSAQTMLDRLPHTSSQLETVLTRIQRLQGKLGQISTEANSTHALPSKVGRTSSSPARSDILPQELVLQVPRAVGSPSESFDEYKTEPKMQDDYASRLKKLHQLKIGLTSMREILQHGVTWERHIRDLDSTFESEHLQRMAAHVRILTNSAEYLTTDIIHALGADTAIRDLPVNPKHALLTIQERFEQAIDPVLNKAISNQDEHALTDLVRVFTHLHRLPQLTLHIASARAKQLSEYLSFSLKMENEDTLSNVTKKSIQMVHNTIEKYHTAIADKAIRDLEVPQALDMIWSHYHTNIPLRRTMSNVVMGIVTSLLNQPEFFTKLFSETTEFSGRTRVNSIFTENIDTNHGIDHAARNAASTAVTAMSSETQILSSESILGIAMTAYIYETIGAIQKRNRNDDDMTGHESFARMHNNSSEPQWLRNLWAIQQRQTSALCSRTSLVNIIIEASYRSTFTAGFIATLLGTCVRTESQAAPASLASSLQSIQLRSLIEATQLSCGQLDVESLISVFKSLELAAGAVALSILEHIPAGTNLLAEGQHVSKTQRNEKNAAVLQATQLAIQCGVLILSPWFSLLSNNTEYVQAEALELVTVGRNFTAGLLNFDANTNNTIQLDEEKFIQMLQSSIERIDDLFVGFGVPIAIKLCGSILEETLRACIAAIDKELDTLQAVSQPKSTTDNHLADRQSGTLSHSAKDADVVDEDEEDFLASDSEGEEDKTNTSSAHQILSSASSLQSIQSRIFMLQTVIDSIHRCYGIVVKKLNERLTSLQSFLQQLCLTCTQHNTSVKDSKACINVPLETIISADLLTANSFNEIQIAQNLGLDTVLRGLKMCMRYIAAQEAPQLLQDNKDLLQSKSIQSSTNVLEVKSLLNRASRKVIYALHQCSCRPIVSILRDDACYSGAHEQSPNATAGYSMQPSEYIVKIGELLIAAVQAWRPNDLERHISMRTFDPNNVKMLGCKSLLSSWFADLRAPVSSRLKKQLSKCLCQDSRKNALEIAAFRDIEKSRENNSTVSLLSAFSRLYIDSVAKSISAEVYRASIAACIEEKLSSRQLVSDLEYFFNILSSLRVQQTKPLDVLCDLCKERPTEIRAETELGRQQRLEKQSDQVVQQLEMLAERISTLLDTQTTNTDQFDALNDTMISLAVKWLKIRLNR